MDKHDFKVGDWVTGRRLGLLEYDKHKIAVQIEKISLSGERFMYKHNSQFLNDSSNWYHIQNNIILAKEPDLLHPSYRKIPSQRILIIKEW